MTDQEPQEEGYAEEVRRKAERMANSRREGASFWRVISIAGTLGWQFVLPLVGCTLLAFALGRAADSDAVVLAGIALGLVLGIWQVARAIDQALEER